MKKVLVFVLVIALTAGSLFAFNGHGGLSMGPSFSWYNVKMKDAPEATSQDTISFVIDLDGATYFTEGRNQFGIGYGMRFDMPLTQKVDDIKVQDDQMMFKFGFAPKVSFQYKYVMNEKFALEAGAGFSWVFYNKTQKGSEAGLPSNAKIKYHQNIFSLMANVGVSYRITNLVGLRAGVELSTPFAVNTKAEVKGLPAGTPGTVMKVDASINGVAVTPYIGVGIYY